MIELVQPLLQHHRRWLIVTSVTFAIALALLVPLADVYFDEQERERELTAELAQVTAIADDIEQLEARVAAETVSLTRYTARTVSPENVNEYRSQLVEMVHKAGCQLRRASVAPVQTRPWREQDDPLLDRHDKSNNQQTGLLLRRQMVTLSVSGSMTSLQSLLQQMREQRMLSHARTLELKPEGRNRNTVMLDLEIWFFDFENQAIEAA